MEKILKLILRIFYQFWKKKVQQALLLVEGPVLVYVLLLANQLVLVVQMSARADVDLHVLLAVLLAQELVKVVQEVAQLHAHLVAVDAQVVVLDVLEGVKVAQAVEVAALDVLVDAALDVLMVVQVAADNVKVAQAVEIIALAVAVLAIQIVPAIV